MEPQMKIFSRARREYCFNTLKPELKNSSTRLSLIGRVNSGKLIILNEDQVDLTILWRRVINQVGSGRAIANAFLMIDTLAEARLKITHYQLTLTRKWRLGQTSAAKRILREHDMSVEEWVNAILWFSEQPFWKTNLTSILQVEKNIQQYLTRKKPRQLDNKRKVIE